MLWFLFVLKYKEEKMIVDYRDIIMIDDVCLVLNQIEHPTSVI